MKKLITLMIIVFCAATLFAQTPDKFSYQAVVRNASNALVTNAPVGVRVSILQGSANGNAVYVETQTATTNANGLLTIEIGGGSTLQGSFASIDWANGPFFLKTESDPAGGSNYTVTSTQQLMSVPYALYAKEAANGFSGDYNDLTNKPTIPSVPANVSAFTNDAGYITAQEIPEIPTVPTNVSAFVNDVPYMTSFTEQQILTISNDTIFLTGGSYVKLPAGFDGDYNSLTNRPDLFSGNYNDLTNKPTIPTVPTSVSAFTNDAGYVTSADIPANVSAFTNDAGYLTNFTEQQVLSISHDTLFLTGGSFVKLPAGFDGDYNSLTNRPDLFSGNYNDLTNKPTNADFGQALVRGTVNNPAGATDIAVTFINYSLMSGGVVSIIFARNVPAGASLNINDQGAKPILWRGAALTDGVIKANDRCLFMYNSGANSYYLLAIDRWGVDIDALAAVARTGSYNDLSDKPTIPTVPTDVSAFNNDAGYITMDSVPAIPTNVSTFTNDAGYVTSADIPNVPTNDSAFTNDAGYLTSFTEQQVLSISHDTLFLTGGSFVKLPAGFDGDYNSLTNRPDLFSGSYNDLTNKPTIPTVPTDVSAFNNDAGYITAEQMPAGMTGTQTGDIMYWDAATSTWIMMPAGSAGQVLTVENGVPVWASLPDYVTMNLPPTVTTNVPTEVTQSSVLCGGVVTSDGSVQLTACGVCWKYASFPDHCGYAHG